jgi:isocitrate dehydrogenase (NAD+)
MMLDHCHLPHMAARLRTAIDQTLNVDKARTGDLGGQTSTAEYTRAVIRRISNV